MSLQRSLTDRTLKSLRPGAKSYLQKDGLVDGLCVRVAPTGLKSFQLRAFGPDGRQRTVTLGRYPELSLADARKAAKSTRAEIHAGEGVAAKASVAARRRAHDAGRLRAVAERFTEFKLKEGKSPRTVSHYEGTLRRYVLGELGDRPIREILRTDIRRLLDRHADKPAVARAIWSTMSALFSYAVDRELVDQSPIVSMRGPKPPASRDRVLTDPEVAAIWKACGSLGTYGAMIRFLLLTGQRVGQVTEMQWRDIDVEVWHVRGETTKSRTAAEVPLPRTTRAILRTIERQGDVVFGGRFGGPIKGLSKLKRSLDKGSGVTDWRLHDLRRTQATGLARLGVAESLIERIQLRSGQSVGMVAQVYNRFSYLAEKRDALEQWSRTVQDIRHAT
jgi:integrase